MKKLFVVLLTVVMVLSLATVASAEWTSYMGGDMYYRYDSVSKTFGAESNTFFVGNIGVKASKDNSWARIFLNTDKWQSLGTAAAYNNSIQYAFGVDKIADILSLSFSTKDQDICNIGQAPLSDTFDDFKTDPIFNTYSFGNSAAAVVDTDAFTFKAESRVCSNSSGEFAVNAIAKFDGSKVYVAYQSAGGDGKSYLADLGGEAKFGDIAFKADIWSSADTYNILQVNAANGPWDATFFYDKPQSSDGIFGLGGNYKLTEKFTVGAKYFSTSTAQYEVYGLYNLGAVDLRLGYAKNLGDLPNAATASATDAYVTFGFHASIW